MDLGVVYLARMFAFGTEEEKEKILGILWYTKESSKREKRISTPNRAIYIF